MSESVMPTSTRAKTKKKSRLWWHVHQWVGLKLSVLLSFVFLTGTLAVFSHELDWLLNPEIRSDHRGAIEDSVWIRSAANIKEAYPDEELLILLAPPAGGFALRARTSGEDHLRFVYIDPASGDIQGSGGPQTLQRILRQTHRHLMMPAPIGVPLVSVLSLLLLSSLGTSLVVYKKWWRGFFKPVRFKNARLAWGDVHRLIGVWSLWFVALVGLTSLWYFAESTVARAPSQASLERPEPAVEPAGATELANALQTLRAHDPDYEIFRIIMPQNGEGYFLFHGHSDEILVRPRAEAVWITPDGSQVSLRTSGDELNAHQRLSEMADPLHFGTFGGVWTKTIWFVFGLGLTALSVSGVAIYAERVRKSLAKADNQAGVVGIALSGMGKWLWPAGILLMVWFSILVFATLRGSSPFT